MKTSNTTKMARYFLKLAYRGTAYHGWQVQQNAHTVQAEMNEKISLLCDEDVHVVGCGRTDSGVHAREFYLHFDLENTLPFDDKNFVFKLNRFLPKDIVVYGVWPVSARLHARFDAVSRRYRYYILTEKDPFLADMAMPYTRALSRKAMQQASEFLLGQQDFTSFSKLHTQTASNICHITEAYWKQTGNQLVFTITADRFLRNMVRAIVGTLLEVGRGKIKPDAIKEIIEAKDRSAAGFSVPAQGLFLEAVCYPSEWEALFSSLTPSR
jgi:tRNA pseudouridine38-40 synthase